MKTKATLNLKQTVTAAIGGLMLIGLLAAGISNIGNRINFTRTVQAQEETKSFTTQSHRQFHCGNATLEGKYAYIGDGFVPGGPPPAPLVPFAVAGIMTMDGAGNISNNATASNNGQILQNVSYGTYNINADCTGRMTIVIPVPPFQLTFNLFVADLQGAGQGKEFYFIGTTPSVVTHTAKRIQ